MCCYSIKRIKGYKESDDNVKHKSRLSSAFHIVKKVLPIRAIIPQVITQNRESY